MMNLPSVPTDNLYKFLALTGVVFVIFGFYSIATSIDDLTKEARRIDLETDLQNYTTGKRTLTAQEKADSIILSHETKNVRSGIASIKDVYTNYSVLIGVGICLICVGFGLWYHRLQRYSDKILKNDADKLGFEKSKITYQVRFQKEYELYEAIWIPIDGLNRSLDKLIKELKENRIVKMEGKQASYLKIKESFAKSHEFFLTFIRYVDQRAPFFPEEIHDQMTVIRGIGARTYSDALLIEFLDKMVDDGVQIELSVENGSEELSKALSSLTEMIRRRIEL